LPRKSAAAIADPKPVRRQACKTSADEAWRHARVAGQLKGMTMDLSDLISPDGIIPALKANSKKQVLQEIAKKAAQMTGLAQRDIFDTLLQRERLGSTATGNGIAIPHGTIQGLERVTVLFARLEKPVEFEAIDEKPVDLVFLLLAPERAGADHLNALSRISRLLSKANVAQKLRASSDRDTLYALLTEPIASHAA
jgi:nitrogen PTS system EIIA component